MTDSELYSKLKDVPKSAWPDCTGYLDGLWWSNGLAYPAPRVKLMFIGSMLSYVLNKYGAVYPKQADSGKYMVDFEGLTFEAATVFDVLVEACKGAPSAE